MRNKITRPSPLKLRAARTLSLIFMMCCFDIYLFAQEEVTRFSPASPDAASLGKYGVFPVSYQTGTVNITIPLYTIKSKELMLPMALNYHPSGIKVDEISSSIGLGWSLDAGGVITRVVKGIADDAQRGFIMGDGDVKTPAELSQLTPAQRYQYYEEVNNGVWDTQSDRYIYNFNGFSGEFHFAPNNEPGNEITGIDDEQKQYIIKFDRGTRTFSIITDDGTEYQFFAKESTYILNNTEYGQSLTANYTSSWFLSKITSSNKTDSIKFNYNQGIYRETRMSGSSESILITRSGYTPPTSPELIGSRTTNHSLITYEIYTTNLNSIEFNGGRAVFSRDSRLDHLDLRRLHTIRIEKLNLAGTYEELLSIKLKNDNYFIRNAPSISGYWGLAQVPEEWKHALKLAAVEFVKADQLLQEFGLEYDTQPLPPVYSTSQDYWGYYNGQQNENLIPLTEVIFPQCCDQPTTIGKANRSSDATYMKAATLRRIIHPTGGYTQFDFEPHYIMKTTTTQHTTQTINGSVSCFNQPPNFFNCNDNSNISDIFIPEGSPATLNYNIVDNRQNRNTPNRPYISLINVTTGQETILKTHNETPVQISGSLDFPVVGGNQYQLKLYALPLSGTTYGTQNINASIVYKKTYTTSVTEKKPVGGLRIKTIKSYADYTSIVPVLQKYFYYGEEVAEGTGPLISNHKCFTYFQENVHGYFDQSNCYSETKRRKVASTNSMVELSAINGSPVEYSKVIEIDRDANGVGNGKIEYDYIPSVYDMHLAARSNFPIAQMSFPVWKRGKLLKKSIYSTVAGVYNLKEENEYVYDVIGLQQFQSYVLYSNYTLSGCYITPQSNYVYSGYFNTIGKKVISREIIRKHENGGSLVDNVTYEYDPQNFFLRKKSTTSSTGHQRSTEFRYPHNRGEVTGLTSQQIQALQNLENRNERNPVIEQKSFDNTNLLETKRINYRHWGSDIIKPETEEESVRNNNPSVRLRYHSYDSKGNITTVSKESDIVINVIWGYNHTFPVAEVSGASYPNIIAILNQTILQNPPSDEALRIELDKIRQNFPQAVVTTYTYHPLIGMTSKTDQNNQVLYYEYDSFGRLKRILDQDKNIVKTFDYQYQQQP